MPIITPAYPQQNSTFNVSHSTRMILEQEFQLGFQLTEDIMIGRSNWDILFEKPNFFMKYKYVYYIYIFTFPAYIYEYEFYIYTYLLFLFQRHSSLSAANRIHRCNDIPRPVVLFGKHISRGSSTSSRTFNFTLYN